MTTQDFRDIVFMVDYHIIICISGQSVIVMIMANIVYVKVCGLYNRLIS